MDHAIISIADNPTTNSDRFIFILRKFYIVLFTTSDCGVAFYTFVGQEAGGAHFQREFNASRP